jgi:hypothetical protein
VNSPFKFANGKSLITLITDTSSCQRTSITTPTLCDFKCSLYFENDKMLLSKEKNNHRKSMPQASVEPATSEKTVTKTLKKQIGENKLSKTSRHRLCKMTLTITSRVKDKISGNEGTVDDIKNIRTNGIKLRYFKVTWDDCRGGETRFYLGREVLEIEPTVLQVIFTLNGKECRFRRLKLDNTIILHKNHFMTEIDVMRFLNPGVDIDRLNNALDTSCNVFGVPALLLNRKPTKVVVEIIPKRQQTKVQKCSTQKEETSSTVTLLQSRRPIFTSANFIDLTLSSDDEEESKENH